MQSILDDGYTWYLRGILNEDDLTIVVVEGSISDVSEDIIAGDHNLGQGHRIDVSEDGRSVAIRFDHRAVVAWQVVNESYTAFDKYEVREGTYKLQTITRSKYLDYVNASHGWYDAIIGPAKHYRIWAEDDVVDVVATQPPIVELWYGER